MSENNTMKLEFDGKTSNIGFARVAVSAFLTQLNPTLEELEDVKTAVSEAVTNSIIHGYEKEEGKVYIKTEICEEYITIEVRDNGTGMENVSRAMEPLFTTKAESEHSGMGFMFMQAFMDEVHVESKPLSGTTIVMKKKIGSEAV